MRMEQRSFDFNPHPVDVLEKFKSVKIKKVDRLNPTDREFVNRVQREYDAVVKNLDWYQKFFETRLEADESPGFEYNRESNRFSRSYDAPWFEQVKFSPKGCLHQIGKLRNTAIQKFVIEVLSYFNPVYNLDIKPDELLKREAIHSDDIVDYIFSQLSGLTLTEKGEENLKANFRKTMYWKDKLKLQGCNIRIDDFFLYDTWRDKYDIGYHYREKANTLRKAISFFELGTLNIQSPLAQMFDDKGVNVTDEYIVNNKQSRVVGLRLYKNGNIKIRFATPEQAHAFWSMFRLDLIKGT